MTETPDLEPAGPDEQSGDYSYDLAHDVARHAPSEAGQPHGSERGAAPVEVSTATADEEGDYSYDLAHDVPRSSPPG